MEEKLNIGYEQLIDIINQLPPEEVSKPKAESERIANKSNSATQNDWKNLLIDGPIMSDEQHQAFEENRKSFNRWRES